MKKKIILFLLLIITSAAAFAQGNTDISSVRKMAEAGNVKAQFHLGNCYYIGKGVAQNYTEAVKWYTKAAQQGHSDAQNNLGICYLEGLGVTKTMQKH